MRIGALLCLCLWMLPLAGCDQPVATGGGSTHPPMLANVSDAPAMSPEDVDLTIVDGEQYAAVLEKHQGKVLLVDYWALWCLSCKENFPHIVELHEEHASKGLAVVSLSMDSPDDEEAVRKFLGENSAHFQNLLSKLGASTESAEEYDYDNAVPLYKLYDRQGVLRFQFGEFPDDLEHGEPIENIDRRVEELLAEPATE